MRVRNHGKYTRMNMRSPRAIATCDYSGLMVKHASLRRQMEYRGRGLVWTGLYVHPHFWDEPNQQDLIPFIKMDPRPIPNARPDVTIDTGVIPILTIDLTGVDEIVQSLQQASYIPQQYIGSPGQIVPVLLPAGLSYWEMTNYTADASDIAFKMIAAPTIYVVTPGQTRKFYSDFTQFSDMPLLSSGAPPLN